MAPDPFSAFVDTHLSEDLGRKAHANSAVVCLASKGTPVVYVSDAFETHTGYSATEAVGKNLSFLQGPETEAESVQHFRELIKSGQSGTVRITNYRKNGTAFLHECEFRPVRNAQDQLTHFIAIQRPVSK